MCAAIMHFSGPWAGCCLFMWEFKCLQGDTAIMQANQWLVARAGGLEVIASAMRGWREYPMVQLCALLCMVPLALDNTVLQARTCSRCSCMPCSTCEHPCLGQCWT